MSDYLLQSFQISDAKLNAAFIKWAEENTPYSSRKTYTFLAIAAKFVHGNKKLDKSIGFNVLRDLSSEKVDKKTAVLSKFKNKVPPTFTVQLSRRKFPKGRSDDKQNRI